MPMKAPRLKSWPLTAEAAETCTPLLVLAAVLLTEALFWARDWAALATVPVVRLKAVSSCRKALQPSVRSVATLTPTRFWERPPLYMPVAPLVDFWGKGLVLTGNWSE